jgi:hypothetical protein
MLAANPKALLPVVGMRGALGFVLMVGVSSTDTILTGKPLFAGYCAEFCPFVGINASSSPTARGGEK